MDKKKRAKKVEKIIRNAYSSLESHLEWTYKGKLTKLESRKFHKKCVQEYAEIIYLASQLY